MVEATGPALEALPEARSVGAAPAKWFTRLRRLVETLFGRKTDMTELTTAWGDWLGDFEWTYASTLTFRTPRSL